MFGIGSYIKRKGKSVGKFFTDPERMITATATFGASEVARSLLKPPGVEGLSATEKQALQRQREAEESRMARIKEALFRRSRSALGGRALLFGTLAGVSSSLGSQTPLGTNSQGGPSG